jgi:hypothetical protein
MWLSNYVPRNLERAMNVHPQLVRQRVDNFVLFERTRFRLKVIEVDPTNYYAAPRKKANCARYIDIR